MPYKSKEDYNAYRREYRKKNPEKERAWRKAYCKRHPETVKEHHKRWCERHPEALKAIRDRAQAKYRKTEKFKIANRANAKRFSSRRALVESAQWKAAQEAKKAAERHQGYSGPLTIERGFA